MCTCAHASVSGDAETTSRIHHCSAHKDAQRGADNAQHTTQHITLMHRAAQHVKRARCNRPHGVDRPNPSAVASHAAPNQARAPRECVAHATHARGCMSRTSHRIAASLGRHSTLRVSCYRLYAFDACGILHAAHTTSIGASEATFRENRTATPPRFLDAL